MIWQKQNRYQCSSLNTFLLFITRNNLAVGTAVGRSQSWHGIKQKQLFSIEKAHSDPTANPDKSSISSIPTGLFMMIRLSQSGLFSSFNLYISLLVL